MSSKIDFGYYAAQEQYSPTQLLEHVISAESYGFTDVWTSDHFHPWFHTGANCGQAWVWLGAAAALTKKMRLGTAVTPPGYRYHPALIAQGFATLDYMFPGRIFLSMATGEAMNESPLGFPWPRMKARRERLVESIEIVRRLWQEAFVTYKGKYFTTRGANLYTKPKKRIPLYVAANGPKTAYVAGRYGDGLLTYCAVGPIDYYKQTLFPAFERGARDAGKNIHDLDRIVQILVSYDEDFDKAVGSCRFWAGTLVPLFFDYGVYDPRVIESVAKMISSERIAQAWMVVTSPEEAIRRTREYLDAGFTHVEYISSSPDESKFIRVFGENVVAPLRDEYD